MGIKRPSGPQTPEGRSNSKVRRLLTALLAAGATLGAAACGGEKPNDSQTNTIAEGGIGGTDAGTGGDGGTNVGGTGSEGGIGGTGGIGGVGGSAGEGGEGGEGGNEVLNTAPEFPSDPTANPNPTDSNIPVTITVPVLDVDGDDVTVTMSFTGDPLGCTYDQNSKVVTGGNGNAVFTMTPQILNVGNVYPHIVIDDGRGGTNSEDLGIWIQ